MMVVWVWGMRKWIRIPDASAGAKPATLMKASPTYPGHHHAPHQRQIHHRPLSPQGRARAHVRARTLG